MLTLTNLEQLKKLALSAIVLDPQEVFQQIMHKINIFKIVLLGCAFVTFYKHSAASLAVQNLHDKAKLPHVTKVEDVHFKKHI